MKITNKKGEFEVKLTTAQSGYNCGASTLSNLNVQCVCLKGTKPTEFHPYPYTKGVTYYSDAVVEELDDPKVQETLIREWLATLNYSAYMFADHDKAPIKWYLNLYSLLTYLEANQEKYGVLIFKSPLWQNKAHLSAIHQCRVWTLVTPQAAGLSLGGDLRGVTKEVATGFKMHGGNKLNLSKEDQDRINNKIKEALAPTPVSASPIPSPVAAPTPRAAPVSGPQPSDPGPYHLGFGVLFGAVPKTGSSWPF